MRFSVRSRKKRSIVFYRVPLRLYSWVTVGCRPDDILEEDVTFPISRTKCEDSERDLASSDELALQKRRQDQGGEPAVQKSIKMI